MQSVTNVLAKLKPPVTAPPLNASARAASSYNCPVCQDIGYVRADIADISHPQFGKLLLCPACGHDRLRATVAARLEKKRAALARMNQSDTGQTFATFTPGLNAQVAEAFYTAQEYAAQPSGWLVLCGTMGTGKTHLLMAVINAQPPTTTALFFTVPDLLDRLRAGYKRNDYEDILDAAQNVALLALDDLGAENDTDWAGEKLFQIFNHRYQLRLPTLVSTNVPLAHLDPRLYSRLSDERLVTCIELYAPDYRARKSAPNRIVTWQPRK